MSLDARIHRSAMLLYWTAAFALAHILFVGLLPLTAVFGSGIVDIAAGLWERGASILASVLAYWAIGTLVALGVLMQYRVRWAPFAALAFVAFDAAVYFAVAAYAATAAGWVGEGLSAALLVVVHGLVFWQLALAAGAAIQYKTNERIATKLDFEARLRRKLEEPDAPPPPAATFTRYRQTPRT